MLSPSPAIDVTSPQVLTLWVELVRALAWPVVAVVGFCFFRRPLLSILRGLGKRIDAGAPIKVYSFEVGQAPINLPAPSIGEVVTANHMALIHSSWRYSKKDAEFGRRMWAFHLVVQARDEVLDRIEYVKYFLDKSYPNAIQVVTDRPSRFKLKELANGESTVRCEVKIKGQEEAVFLTRYINLADTGPRI
jgi:hypothetical protein